MIAAYLPNEAATIVETVEAFLAQDYPDLQVILAYNTPHPLPVEEELRGDRASATRGSSRYRVEGSVSKAQNVNAALARVRGEIVGVFDADHHPDTERVPARGQWLASGVDVVQGHCVVRNGGDELRHPARRDRVRGDLRGQPSRVAPASTSSGSSAARTATGGPRC